MYVVGTHLAYLVVSFGLTVWVARTLSRNGRVFLADSFQGNEPLADSVNQLLVVGFYLLNFGYVTLALKYADKPRDLAESIESLCSRIGVVLLVLGGLHFFNLYIFSKMRRRVQLRSQKPPVAPEGYVEPAQAWGH